LINTLDMINYIFYIIYAIFIADKNRESESNIIDTSRDVSLFILMVNYFTIFIIFYNIIVYVKLIDGSRVLFSILAISYVFIIRYLILIKYNNSKKTITEKYNQLNYSKEKVTVAAISIFLFTFLFLGFSLLFIWYFRKGR
jgi:hypothetical protein